MIGVYFVQYETDKQKAHSDFINYCWYKRLNRLEINALGRELSKQRVQDKRAETGNERVHVWSGLAPRSNSREDGQDAFCYK